MTQISRVCIPKYKVFGIDAGGCFKFKGTVWMNMKTTVIFKGEEKEDG